MSKENPVIYMIVGEPSGDLLASRFMKAFSKKTDGKAKFIGLGGESMIDGGFESLFDISDLAIMGLAEVLPKIPLVLRRINQTVKDIKEKKPDIILSVDSWSFAARVLKKIKKENLNIPCIHYVAPQVWAWKKSRAKTMHEYIDHLLCLLPYEPEIFAPYNLKADFVGHPVIEGGSGLGNKEEFFKKHNLTANDLIITVLPGSRKNEVSHLLPVFYETLQILKAKYPNLKVVLPVVKTVKDKVLRTVANWDFSPIITFGEKERYDAFASSDVALAASGTVGLELSKAKVPHLIAYKLSPLTAFIARRLVKIKYVNLINILAGKEIIPEMIQENANPALLAQTLDNLIKNQDIRKQQLDESSEILATKFKNGDNNPSDLASEIVLSYLK